MSIIIATIFVVTIILSSMFGAALTWKLILEQLFYNVYYAVPLTLVNSWYTDFIGKRFPWYERPKERVAWGITGSIVVTLVTTFIATFFLRIIIFGENLNELYSSNNQSFYFSALTITIIVTTALHAIGFFKEVQNERKLNAQLQKEKLEMELNALRAHVDPHFLFNSFNVLSGLIDENKDKAQDFLAGLSKIYRYVLERRHEETSTVEEEMQFAYRYLELQRMRFEDGILFKTQITDQAHHKKIP
ncbi:MAG: histidine kinase, partial [Bacteroidota bacterium]